MNRCFFLAVMPMALLPLTAVGQVFLSQSTLLTAASDGASTSTRSDNALLPWLFTREVIKAPSSAATTYDFTTAGDAITFHIDLDHARGGAAGNSAHSYGFFTVTPLADMFYSISGDYASTGGGTTGLEIGLTIGSENLFTSLHRSSSSGDHAFVVGQPGGTVENVVSGNISGVMQAYQNYLFSYDAEIEEFGGINSATATGDLYLNLTPVPEPATILMVGLTVAVGGRRRRRRAGTDS